MISNDPCAGDACIGRGQSVQNNRPSRNGTTGGDRLASTGGGPPLPGQRRQHGTQLTGQAASGNGATRGRNTSTGGGSSRGAARRRNGASSNRGRGNDTGSNRARQSQSRAGTFRANGGVTRSARNRLKKFARGKKKLQQSLIPTTEQLLAATDKECRQQTVRGDRAGIDAHAAEIYHAGQDEAQIVQEILSQWKQGGHGYVPEVKEDDVVRLTNENVNNLGLYAKGNWKVKKLGNLNNKYQADGTLMQELGTNWSMVPDNLQPDTLFGGAKRSKIVVAHNVHERFSRCQQGGTAVVAFSRLAGFVQDSGRDKSGLGRYSWVKVGTEM